MITLYGMGSPNVSKVVIMLEELGLSYEFRRVNVFASEQFGPEIDALNPNHKVPVLVDEQGPDGGRHVLFESAAILIYLAEKAGRLLPSAGAMRFETFKWLMFQVAGVGPMIGQLNHFRQGAPEGNDYSIRRYTNEMYRLYDVLDRRLADNEFLAGAEYSIADISTHPWVNAYERYGLYWSDRPNLSRWWHTVSARPGVVAAAARMAPLWEADREAWANAAPADMDRFYNRKASAAS